MSYGFLALNDNNQVLVSSDTRNLHFIQKLTGPVETLYSTDDYGGIRQWRYRATCAAIPLPFFTMPTADSYGVARIVETSPGSGVWDIEILRSGTSGTYPELYIFAEPKATSSADTYGMVVYADDGVTPSFDSRLKPLVVNGGIFVSQTAAVRYSGVPYGLSSDYCSTGSASSGGIFTPEGVNTYSFPNISDAAKPIYSYNSLAQAQRQHPFGRSNQECIGIGAYGGCIGYGTEETWNSYYWCFYRGGIKKTTAQLGPPTTWDAYAVPNQETITPEYADIYGDGNLYPTGNYVSDFTTYTFDTFGSPGLGNVDDGFRVITLPWAVRGPDYANTGQTRLYNTMAVSTNGYITFNDSYGLNDRAFGMPGSSVPADDITKPSGYRIAAAAGDYWFERAKVRILGTSPNRYVTYIIEGRPYGTGTNGVATIFWHLTFFEAFPSTIEYVLRNGSNTLASRNVSGVFVAGTSIGVVVTDTASGNFTNTGVRVQGSYVPVLQATWIPTRFNCFWTYEKDSAFFGIGTGGGGSQNGTWPYNNETLNIINNAVILSNGARYD